MRRTTRARLALVLAMTWLSADAGAQLRPDAAPAPLARRLAPIRAPSEYLVTLAAEADVQAIADTFGRLGIRSTRHLTGRLFLVQLTGDPGLPRMEELCKQDNRIAAVQPNHLYRLDGGAQIR